MKRLRQFSWFQPARRRAGSARGFQPQLEGLEERCVPTTWTVMNANDQGTGSLRDMIAKANHDTGDTIVFSPTLQESTINLQSSLVISKNMTIIGLGSNITLNRVGSSSPFSLVVIAPLAHASISGLTFRNGYSTIRGGGIDNQGTLALNDCVVTGNTAVMGAGLANELGCTATLVSCQVTNNQTTAGSGGGIFNAGTLTLQNTIISDNQVPLGGNGGGIENQGSLTLTQSVVSSNTTASGKGGGIDNQGSLTLTGSAITGNTAATAPGGGICSTGTLKVLNSTISGNVSKESAQGGGIADLGNGPMTLINSTIANNLAFSEGQFNTGGGGLYIAAAPQSQITLLNCTVANNSAVASSLVVAGVGSVSGLSSTGGIGGGLEIVSGLVTLNNTIVAQNTAPTAADISGTVYSASHSLFGSPWQGKNVTYQILTQKSNLYSTTPGLGVLQNNGGLTQTISLLANSPAINHGDNSLLTNPLTGTPLTTDQTGRSRIVSGTVDIGAYEYQPPETAMSLSHYRLGSRLRVTAQVRAIAPGSSPIQGTVSFYIDGVLQQTVILSNGRATFNLYTLSKGIHTVFAYFTPANVGDFDVNSNSASVRV